MHRPQQQVRDFHRACGLPAPGYVNINWNRVRGVTTDLMVEELEEFIQATAAEDVLEAIDALCDLLYVTYGAAVAMGIDLEPFYEEVQRANMEKCGGPKREDGKQLKPEGWRGPDHKAVYRRTYGGSTYTIPGERGIPHVRDL